MYTPECCIRRLAVLEGPRISAKCKSVQMPQANLPDTAADLTSASKYFQMLPGPPGAEQSALRLHTSILRGFWKHLQLWRCIQHAPTFEYCNSQILEQLRPLCKSTGDFESSIDLCAHLQKSGCCILTAVDCRVPEPQGILSFTFIFVTVTRFSTS